MGEWKVEVTAAWRDWWAGLKPPQRREVSAVVRVLESLGPTLPFPYSSAVKGSSVGHLRELRVQAGGRALRSLYAFDPRRVAILLVGGDKSGDARWYKRSIARAEELYEAHLADLRQRGFIP